MPGGDMPGDDMGDMPSDATGGDMGGSQPGDAMGDGDGSESAGNMSGTPPIPAGTATPTDAPGSAPGAAVAMNGGVGAPAGGVVPGAGMPEPLPDLSNRNTESASSGCSLPARGSSGGGIAWGLFGLFALLGLRRER
jgi:uncharacterized protein (TIGR03382 family)